MPKITFVNEKKDVEVPSGSNLREVALKEGIPLYPGLTKYLNCRGLGSCGTCRVFVTKGLENVNPKGWKERARLALMPFATIGHEDDLRLGCQLTVNGDCSVVTQAGVDLSGENFWQKPYPNK
ncbi:MAG TPA: 2Fe-2S iron-sulfur cluster-binding protein [Gemmatales bacterium]|nr:2Fe-2S iron-sulfur cluster-binding protein [Gemmatales bacterium]HMP61480.1 2Fe-2S iron-sulfur cluster-binding protein [Gemmatales bacterium]